MLDAAERGRIAHRVKVLKEVGVDSVARLNSLVRQAADAGVVPNPGVLGPTAPGAPFEAPRIVRVHDDINQGEKFSVSLTNKEVGWAGELFDRSLFEIQQEWQKWVEKALYEWDELEAERILAQWSEKEQQRAEEDAARLAEGDGWTASPPLITANALYDKAREAFLAGDLAWDSHDIRAVLVDTGLYTVNLGTHDFLDDIAAGARVSVSGSFTNKTVTAGVADADDVTHVGVTGASVEAIALYSHDGGADSARRLVGFIDTGTGLPVTPNTGDIQTVWDSGANRIFKL